MARGIDRQTIVRDDADRDAFVERLARVTNDGGLVVYAWAIMPSHFHLLVRTGTRPLEKSMRSLLTGLACAFNRRHDRVGHVFQNRYKSILCENESYLTTLVRYIHRNPLRAGIVGSLAELDVYPYCGHSALMGQRLRPWQETNYVLALFSGDRQEARAAYRRFVSSNEDSEDAEKLRERGVRWTRDGWIVLSEIVRGRERFVADERVIPGDGFARNLVERYGEGNQHDRRSWKQPSFEEIVKVVCSSSDVTPEALLERGRSSLASSARQGLAFLWLNCFGRSGRELAMKLGITPVAVYRAAKRALRDSTLWLEAFERLRKDG